MTDALILVLFPLLAAFAMSQDLVSMTISNRVSLVLIGGFMAAAYLVGMSWEQFMWHWAAALMVLVGSFSLFALGWIGGGDAKFVAAASLWLGWSFTMDFILLSTILGGGLTLLLLVFRSQMMPLSMMKVDWIARLHRKDVGVPYGIALGAAALWIYPKTAWFSSLSLAA